MAIFFFAFEPHSLFVPPPRAQLEFGVFKNIRTVRELAELIIAEQKEKPCLSISTQG